MLIIMYSFLILNVLAYLVQLVVFHVLSKFKLASQTLHFLLVAQILYHFLFSSNASQHSQLKLKQIACS